jgi:hypothetical protein
VCGDLEFDSDQESGFEIASMQKPRTAKRCHFLEQPNITKMKPACGGFSPLRQR